MTIKEMRSFTGMSQVKFGEYLGIPRRTIENWEKDNSKCPSYVNKLIEFRLKKENFIPENA